MFYLTKNIINDINNKVKEIKNYFEKYPNNKFIINIISTDFYNHYIAKQYDDYNTNIDNIPICSMLKDVQFFTKEEAEFFCNYINSNKINSSIEIGLNQTLTIKKAEIINIDEDNTNIININKISSEHNYNNAYKQ